MTSWSDFHRKSESAAIAAAALRGQGDLAQAASLYAQAADLEQNALAVIEPSKIRTRGITAVSAVALWYKAAEYDRAESLAYAMLSDADIPGFARKDLRDLVQAIWTESSKQSADVGFLPGQVLVSVKGGEVITGGAPLDLVVEKVQTIQSMFYRTVEFMQDLPFRTRGVAPQSIQDSCRPWLFQAPPGSYQFAIAIQQPAQRDLFKEELPPEMVADQFFHILRATTADDHQLLEAAVSKPDYRNAFLKLSRNLAPTGKKFESIEFSTPAAGPPVSLTTEVRTVINRALKDARPNDPADSTGTEEILIGTLRAVDLDKDFLTVVLNDEAHIVTGLKDALDDVIGPMVNKKVKVTAWLPKSGRLRLRDIEIVD